MGSTVVDWHDLARDILHFLTHYLPLEPYCLAVEVNNNRMIRIFSVHYAWLDATYKRPH